MNMGRTDRVDILGWRLWEHLTSADLPREIERDLREKSTPEETTLASVSLQEIAAAIEEDIDPAEWARIQSELTSQASGAATHRIYEATADYFLLRDHGHLDLTRIFLEQLDVHRTIRTVDSSWIEPNPLLAEIDEL